MESSRTRGSKNSAFLRGSEHSSDPAAPALAVPDHAHPIGHGCSPFDEAPSSAHVHVALPPRPGTQRQ